MATHTETLRIRLDPELKRIVEAAAKQWGVSVSAAARRMIAAYAAGGSRARGADGGR